MGWQTMDHSRIKRPVFRSIVNQIYNLGCEVLAINGIPDHVHLVVKLKSTIAISLLVKQAKGVSAKFINEQLVMSGNFRWRGGYGAFTISRWDLQMITNYVNNQKPHHQEGSHKKELELKVQEDLKRP